MNRSYRLLVICAVLSMVAGVVFWLGLGQVPTGQVEEEVDTVIVDEASESAEIAQDNFSEQLPDTGQIVRVAKVVDGDTIVVNIGGQDKNVRLIGIDTPETVDPRRPVGCYGKEASNEAHRLMDGQSVVLVRDVSDTDKYSRLLRCVYVVRPSDDWLFVNDYMVVS